MMFASNNEFKEMENRYQGRITKIILAEFFYVAEISLSAARK